MTDTASSDSSSSDEDFIVRSIGDQNNGVSLKSNKLIIPPIPPPIVSNTTDQEVQKRVDGEPSDFLTNYMREKDEGKSGIIGTFLPDFSLAYKSMDKSINELTLKVAERRGQLEVSKSHEQ